MYEILHHVLDIITEYTILAFEFVGIIILILSGIKGIRDYIEKNMKIRLNLAEGMALALEFKLGSEIARTVIIREMGELYFIAGLIILRASLTFLIHWEIDYEERAEAQKRARLEHESGAAQVCEPPKSIDDGEKHGLEKVLDARFGHSEKAQREKAQAKYSSAEH